MNRSSDSSEHLLQVKDLQRIYGLGRDTCYQLLNRKDFPSVRIGTRHYVQKKKMEEWLNNESRQKNKRT